MFTLFELAFTKLQDLISGARNLLSDITKDWPQPDKDDAIWCDVPCDNSYANCYCRRAIEDSAEQ